MKGHSIGIFTKTRRKKVRGHKHQIKLLVQVNIGNDKQIIEGHKTKKWR